MEQCKLMLKGVILRNKIKTKTIKIFILNFIILLVNAVVYQLIFNMLSYHIIFE